MNLCTGSCIGGGKYIGLLQGQLGEFTSQISCDPPEQGSSAEDGRQPCVLYSHTEAYVGLVKIRDSKGKVTNALNSIVH